MADDSELYHKWLGIPPKDQPPNHYRLLGVELFESDPDVIENAADQRLTHVRRFQTGANSANSQRILNEIASARICLLNPAQKAAYDAKLRQTWRTTAADANLPASAAPVPQPVPIGQPLLPSTPRAAHAPASGMPAEPAAALGPLTRSRRSAAPGRKRGPAATIAGVVLGGIAGVALAYVALSLISPQNDFLNIWHRKQIAQSSPPAKEAEALAQPVAPVTPTPSAERVAPARDPEPSPRRPVEQPTETDPPAPAAPPEISTDDVVGAAKLATTDEPTDEPAAVDAETAPPSEPQESPSPPADDSRLAKSPLPEAEAIAMAAEEIRKVFESDFQQAGSGAEKSALAKRMIDGGLETEDLPTRLALFQAARNLAVSVADVPMAFAALDAVNAAFDDDLLRQQARVLRDVSEQVQPARDHESLAEFFASVIDDAIGQDRFDLAQPLADLAVESARKSKNTEHMKSSVERRRRVQDLAETYAEVEAAIAALAVDPNDPEANLVAGRYLAFVKQDWEAGLEHLANGSDALLGAAAKVELAAPETPAGQEKLADAWWEAAEAEQDATAKNLCRVRSAHWYRQVVGELADLSKVKAERRINEVPVVPPPLVVAPFDVQRAMQYQQAWANHLGTTVEVTNSIGMKLRLIPPGEFMMGSSDGEADRASDEGPRHRVRLTTPYYLGMYEVTQNEYERVMGSNPSWFSRTGGGSGTVSGHDTSRFPVEMVLWEEAVEFCRKLSTMPGEQSSGRAYRLPTEAEWEYACRAGTTTPFHFGSMLNGRQANCHGNHPYGTSSKGPHLGRTARVGSYAGNGFGLHDMHGNVWEWCSDWYRSDYYAASAVDDPTGPATGTGWVLRGGGWSNDAGRCRSARRNGNTLVYRSNNLGFRVVSVSVDASGT